MIELLQKSIDYIEGNLKSELSLRDVANETGFSIYHFSRIFSNYVGVSVSAYITRRRILHIIYETQNLNQLVDTALLYGFDTYAGFYKAFKREFGCSPSKYLELNIVKRPMIINLYREANIMLTKTQILQFLKNWSIEPKPEVKSVFKNQTNNINKTWIINDKFIFKVSSNISELKTHIIISNALKELGIETSYPILTKDGKDFITEGDRHYILTNKVEGEFLSNEERYKGNRFDTGSKYGEAIGKLHKTLKDQEGNLDVDDTELIEIALKWAVPETKKIMEQWNCQLPEEFYKNYIHNLSKYYHQLPRQIIHRDPNPTNILFKDGEVNGFIDFDISERNIRIFDICYCATGILSETEDYEKDFDKWLELKDGIIAGYDSICPLTDIEKLSIPYVIYTIQMIFIAWLNGKEEHKQLAIKNRNMLIKLYNYFNNL